MADNEPTISMAGINAPPLYRLVEDGDKTVIMTADTNTPMWVIDGKIGGGGVEVMTTAERTAITPEAGQLIYDTDTDMLYVGDGITAGGNAVSPGSGGGDYTAGYGISIIAGSTISRAEYGTIETVDVSGASPSVTMVPGHAYSINATTKAVTLNVASFNANQFGIDEGHLEIFVAGTGYVVTGTNVELVNPLEPDAINYCTVRFVGGVAKIALEDNIGGYIVVSPTGTTAGTLPYALSSATQEYVAFDAITNGATIDLSGVTASSEKHIVGNGFEQTTLTGAVDCGTSTLTVANLALQDVVVNGGTMTLGDAFIPSGSTVAVSGGGLAVEKVTGNGGVIDLGGVSRISVSAGSTASAEFCVFQNGYSSGGGGTFAVSGNLKCFNCTIKGSSASYGNAINLSSGSNVELSGCTISSNIGSSMLYLNKGSHLTLRGCTLSLESTNQACLGYNSAGTGANAVLELYETIKFDKKITYSILYLANISIYSGCTLDFSTVTESGKVAGNMVVVEDNVSVIPSGGGDPVFITAGTYSAILLDGTTEPYPHE